MELRDRIGRNLDKSKREMTKLEKDIEEREINRETERAREICFETVEEEREMCTCHIGTFDSGESERVKEVEE